MDYEVNIYNNKPQFIDFDKGSYLYCTCGFSKDGVICDKTHRTKNTTKPILLDIKKKKTLKICLCKHSKTMPFCDKSHLTI